MIYNRLPFLWPEIVLFIATCIVMVVGLSPTLKTRKLSASIAGLGVALAGVLAYWTPIATDPHAGQVLLPAMVPYAKVLIAAIGLLLLMLLAGTVDRAEENAIASGLRRFDPLRSNRAEFYAFYLFSLTGLMLCAGADDLIWLFLALELTSLPTYIMVTISTARNRSREAGVKYFFLGALGAAVFLYGFALIYGGTGTTNLNNIASSITAHGLNAITLAGMLLSLIGLGFKIAAVPMHFYTADVYEGAAPQVSAFLAFVPKTAGFLGILLLTATMGWTFVPGHHGTPAHSAINGTQLPEVIRLALWVISALTMTVGNVLAILQNSVKRILAYSSIAHSGYMLVGVIAGPGNGTFTQNGLAAVLFYLMAYGLMNLGCFAVLAALERRPGPDGEPREVESVADLRGLCTTQPALGWTMVLCALSLLGFPPLLGFFGKLPLFTSAIAAKEYPLVIVLGINSAIAAFYYLRIAFAPVLDRPDPTVEPAHPSPFRSRRLAGLIAAGAVVILAVGGFWLMSPIMKRTSEAAAYRPTPASNSMPRLGSIDPDSH
jgi:NADH-quinone oxidoreductase subunit N